MNGAGRKIAQPDNRDAVQTQRSALRMKAPRKFGRWFGKGIMALRENRRWERGIRVASQEKVKLAEPKNAQF